MQIGGIQDERIMYNFPTLIPFLTLDSTNAVLLHSNAYTSLLMLPYYTGQSKMYKDIIDEVPSFDVQ